MVIAGFETENAPELQGDLDLSNYLKYIQYVIYVT